jgi:hypothetical protein
MLQNTLLGLHVTKYVIIMYIVRSVTSIYTIVPQLMGHLKRIYELRLNTRQGIQIGKRCCVEFIEELILLL